MAQSNFPSQLATSFNCFLGETCALEPHFLGHPECEMDDLDELDEEWPMIKGAMPFLKLMKVQVCPKLKLFPIDVTREGQWKKG